MMAVETERRSYAQVAAASIVDVTSTLPSPSPSPAPAAQNPTARDCAVRASKLSSGLGHNPGGRRGKSVKTKEAAAEGALTAARPVSDRPRVLVELTSGGGAAVLVALADTGASTSLITRGVAERIRLIVRDSDIELTGLSGPTSTVGEAAVGLRVSEVNSKLQVRVIVVEDLPEGQEMLLACADLKAFGLIHQEFPKPCNSSGDTLQVPSSTRRFRQGYGGKAGLRRRDDAFVASEVDSEPLTIDRTLFRLNEERQR